MFVECCQLSEYVCFIILLVYIHGHMHVMFNLVFEILMKLVVSLEICSCVTAFAVL